MINLAFTDWYRYLLHTRYLSKWQIVRHKKHYFGLQPEFLTWERIKNMKNDETRISPRILLFSCQTIYFGPIGGEKQNFTSFLLVEIKFFIKKTKIFLTKYLFFKSVPCYLIWISKRRVEVLMQLTPQYFMDLIVKYINSYPLSKTKKFSSIFQKIWKTRLKACQTS